MASTTPRAAASGKGSAMSQALIASARRFRPCVPRREASPVSDGVVRKSFVNLQPGGGLVAVNEYKGRAHARNTPVTRS